MPLPQIGVLPEQSSYSVQYAQNSIGVKYDGGRSRIRLNKKNGVSTVQVRYNLNRDDYQYFWAFFRNSTNRGATPFLSQLYLNSKDLTLHTCKFVPGSVALVSQQGEQFVVGATLEVSDA